MAKYQHIPTGQVVEVVEGVDHEHWTPDNQGHDPEFARENPKLWQPKPWFGWAQWKQVHDSTPVTPPKSTPVAVGDSVVAFDSVDGEESAAASDAAKVKTGK